MIVETNYPHCILERDKVSYLHQNIYTWILSTYLHLDIIYISICRCGCTDSPPPPWPGPSTWGSRGSSRWEPGD